MKSVEAAGKTTEEAIAQALFELGATADEAVIEVLEETKGFLGLGHAVRVRATLKEGLTPAEGSEAPEPTQPEPEPVPAEADEGPTADMLAAMASGEDVQEGAEEEAAGGEPRLAALADEACAVAQRIVDLMGVPAAARVVSIESNQVTLALEGSDVGMLIGKHGETLDALQLLVAVIANRKLPHGGRVLLDAEDYRARRTKMLMQMARTQADKVKETKQEVVIPGLKAYERRIIHLALRDDPTVDTYSEGQDRDRQLVITPVE